MELRRAEELVIYGAPEETRKFILTCDGKRMGAELDERGMFSLPLPSGAEKVRVRLEKSGTVYPVFHAVLTRNRGEGK